MSVSKEHWDNRDRLVLSWSNRAHEELQRDDSFAAFFFAYMALVAASARGLTAERDDSPLIEDYFQRNAERLPLLFEICAVQVRYFAGRMSASGNAPVLEFMGVSEARANKYYPIVQRLQSPIGVLPLAEMSEAVAVLLIRIRNNLFHGNKDYDSTSDAAVLAHAVLLILAATALFEDLERDDG